MTRNRNAGVPRSPSQDPVRSPVAGIARLSCGGNERSQAVDPFSRWFFYREVERQCRFACMAYEDLTQASGEYDQPHPVPHAPNSEDVAHIQLSMARHEEWLRAMAAYEQKRAAAYDRLWYAVQGFLVAAGNISKLLWPSDKPIFPERGPEIRAGLRVEDDSQLKARTLRNHFEHFDERLERWAASPEPLTLGDSYIGSEGAGSGLVSFARLRLSDA